MRDSGEPYIIHPLNVAYILAEMNLDEQSIAAALLHDVVEDTETPMSEIKSSLGKRLQTLLTALQKYQKWTFLTRKSGAPRT